MRRPELRVKHILKWADNFRESFKRWPKRSDGRITGSLGETWLAIDMTLRKRGRGLVVRSSLAQLLEEYRGVRNRSKLPRLTFKRILEWADDHFAKYKTWPTINCGKVMHAPEESWSAIDKALKGMCRGLSPRSSLAKLLSVHRKVRSSHHLPNLNLNQILQWADAYYARHGKWPTRNSCEVPELADNRGYDLILPYSRAIVDWIKALL